ncbi:Rv3654c family TadE-like protein [Leifsonia poae]|uniref:Rv3654c family TadE-like protein n=1 Tax=Leifsonia poae TaxID=110933 RepID=UPI003D68B77C
MKPRWWRDDAGAGSVLALGIACAVVTVAGGAMTVVGASAAQARAAVAADLAALGAADAASGRIGGVPCDTAGQVAQANGAALAACDQAGTVVTVTATTPYLVWHAKASARAGPAAPR